MCMFQHGVRHSMGKQAIRTINMVWLGIVLAIAYWPFEAIVDAILSGEGTFSEQSVHIRSQ